MAEQQHIIKRMEVQVNASGPKLAGDLQQQLGYRLHTAAFMTQLNTLLDGLVREDEYIEIPAISISLQCANENDFQTQLLSQLAAAIRKQLATQQAANIIIPNGAEYTLAVQLFFLRYGIRAFDNGSEVIRDLQEALQALPVHGQPEVETLLKTAGKDDPVVWIRLYYLLGAAGMKQLFLRMFSAGESDLQIMIAQELARAGKSGSFTPSGSTINDNITGTVTLVNTTAVSPPDAPVWVALFQRAVANGIVAGVPATDEKAKNATNDIPTVAAALSNKIGTLTDQLKRGLQIENAGLVLLWMECGRLFRTLGHVADRQFVDEAAQQRAILLLHYICYGRNEQDGEEYWLLNKLLCNWPLHLPVDPALAPDDAAQQAADSMLTDYLEAWRKDRKFSAEWFSTAFLQREGQLSQRSDGAWILTLSARTEDILINKVSMVKYAWMPQILYVQW
ncbi:MAG: hypothetical protein J7623_22225 [Chitinophaga sp.]|uniref:contractile injection system tape measure protein n=1 Tax=Chitinophaga sp. TaxID=1869181 RepID=UPI001B22E040|nr:contractile injection system tape measure protein [Chitinophaga sp.]MBO9731373.1 hypothetical protein [Chitinophaga sp.]